ncbi:ClbS/DfsB family four-helix bundle protein [Bacillus cereus]|uniref:ClbS/DfsB family four-helix bundle protein n=1 Tax=Bacillus cereus TaxID=1396 RepID=UPI0018F60EE8|nr:ClbS/DfsB family four-helix bundle protein [Bacillus cereus]MBJ8055748.1 ClbS/DfsB family four-helix bundle protein [Bacillus cereus]
MQTYENKEQLVQTIQSTYDKFIKEFHDISNDEKDKQILEVDRTPSQMLSYQLGWTSLLLSWEKDEMNGVKVQTPTPEYKWNNLGGLYKDFYKQYENHSLDEQINILNQQVDSIINWINTLTDKELFNPEQRDWATTKAKWPIYKWIHINTIAPFKTFIIKIRKWKKLNNY